MLVKGAPGSRVIAQSTSRNNSREEYEKLEQNWIKFYYSHRRILWPQKDESIENVKNIYVALNNQTSNGSWCMGIKGEMSGTVCVTFTWYMGIYELFIAFVCFVVCSLL